MKKLKHVDALTVADAVFALNQNKGNSKIIAGGTDLIGALKDEVYAIYPEVVINIKNIPSLNYIKEEAGMLKIGALTNLDIIASSSIVKGKYLALAQAADMVASPNIRCMGTIGGNICQETRCWYFRSPWNRFECLKKNRNGLCYALLGDNRYHSIFGAIDGCVCVNPSDVAPALVAFDAKVVTSKRELEIIDFFDVGVAPNSGMTVLDMDEIVTEIKVPQPLPGTKSCFLKLAIRKSIDFPIVNCAAVIGSDSASICLNAVSGKPKKVTTAEQFIAGKEINEANAQAAADEAVKSALSLGQNKYMVQIAKTLVKRAILACK